MSSGLESKHANLDESVDSLGSFDSSMTEECFAENRGGSVEDDEFDEIVGLLQEIIMSPEFVTLQSKFCRKHCNVFEDTDENKLEYTPIFENYTAAIETYIERSLLQHLPGFEMDKFARMCQEREDEVCGDVFDVLLSCGDFQEFKHLMLSHKRDAKQLPAVVSTAPRA